jgi:hypothetical protein
MVGSAYFFIWEEKEMENETKFVYFKRNVTYTVGGKFFVSDPQGFVLTNVQPWVAVPVGGLRDFKMANKIALMEGIIVETSEPSVEWETPNALTDEDMDELLKSYLKLKSKLLEVTSKAMLIKLLERAKLQNKSTKIVDLIQERLDVLSPEDTITPQEMRGVS